MRFAARTPRTVALASVLALACACGDGGSSPLADVGVDAEPPDAPADAAHVSVDAALAPLPAELADEEALARLADWAGLAVLGEGRYRQQSSTDRGTAEPTSIELLMRGNRDLDHFVCASSDAELRGELLVPPVLDLPSCPEPWVRGFVVSRFEGSGELTRLWMTMLSARSGTLDRELLRIYVDDDPTPRVEVPLAAVIDGSAGEVFAPPFGAGATSHLAWYYPVVFSRRLVVAIDRLGPADLYYHQTDVVLDETPRARTAASSRLDARDAARAALEGRSLPSGDAREMPMVLGPGERSEVLALEGPATIQRLVIDAAAADVAALGEVDIAVRWDDGEPAIALPLLELFGAALDAPPSGGLVLSTTTDASGRTSFALRLPMPFASRAVIALSNRGGTEVRATLRADVTPGVPAAAWGHLHALRSDTVGPTLAPEHLLARVLGRGRLAGVCLAMEGHALEGGLGAALNFLEGDERLLLDGEPAVIGTGTEDYFDDAFYFEDGDRVTPHALAWGVVTSGDAGRASACRWHVLGDHLDFRESLAAALEIGPGVPSLLDRYRSVAFVYVASEPAP